jgi:hypothetical protein
MVQHLSDKLVVLFLLNFILDFKIAFKTSDFEIDERNVGDIGDIVQDHCEDKEPVLEQSTSLNEEYCDYTRLRNNKFKAISYESICSASQLNSKDEIILCDSVSAVLRVLDSTYYEQTSYVNPDGRLHCPVSVCVNNHTNQIFVGDYNVSKVLVFNEDFKFISDFGHESIKKPFCVTVDEETNHVYVTDKRNDSVSVWMPADNRFVFSRTFTCDTPAHIKVFEDKLYIVSGIYYEMKKNTKQLKQLTKGKNCIFVFDKQVGTSPLSVIEFPGCFDLRGLHVNKQFLFTTARTSNDYRKLYRITCPDYDSKQYSDDICDGTVTVRDMLFVGNTDVLFVRGKHVPPIHIASFDTITDRQQNNGDDDEPRFSFYESIYGVRPF